MIDVEITTLNSEQVNVMGMLDNSKGLLYVRAEDNQSIPFQYFFNLASISAHQLVLASKFMKSNSIFHIECKSSELNYSFNANLSTYKMYFNEGGLLVFGKFENFIEFRGNDPDTNEVVSIFFKTRLLDKAYLNYFSGESLNTLVDTFSIDLSIDDQGRNFGLSFRIMSTEESAPLSNYFDVIAKLRHYLTLVFGSNILLKKFKAFTGTSKFEFHTTIYNVHLYDSNVIRVKSPAIKVTNRFLNDFCTFVEAFNKNEQLFSMYISTKFTDTYEEVRLSLLVNSIEGFFRTFFKWAQSKRSKDKDRYVFNTGDLILITISKLPTVDSSPILDDNRMFPDIDCVYGPSPGNLEPPFYLNRELASFINYHRNFYSHLNDFKQDRIIDPLQLPLANDLLDLFFRVQILHFILNYYDEEALTSSMFEVYGRHINHIR